MEPKPPALVTTAGGGWRRGASHGAWLIGKTTPIRLNKFAIGESFTSFRLDGALAGGQSAVRPALCYDLGAREEAYAVLAILVKVAKS